MRFQHVRIARATNQLQAIAAFYHEILGLDVLSTFNDHGGFNGVMLGRLGDPIHFEFTQEIGVTAEIHDSNEDLIVFYLADADWIKAVTKLESKAIQFVPSHNPYWDEHGRTIRDPDGRRIVLNRGTWSI